MAKEVLTEERLTKLDDYIGGLQGKKGILMPILNESQKIFGCIPLPVQEKISKSLDIPMAEIYGVVTFYSQFSLEPKGDYVLGVCMGTACYVKKAQKLIDEITNIVGIGVNDTCGEGKFTLIATRCVGACGLAPLITVNEAVYGKLDPSDVADILAKY